MQGELREQQGSSQVSLNGVTAGQGVRDNVVLAGLMTGGEVVALQLGNPTVVLAVGTASCCASKEIL